MIDYKGMDIVFRMDLMVRPKALLREGMGDMVIQYIQPFHNNIVLTMVHQELVLQLR